MIAHRLATAAALLVLACWHHARADAPGPGTKNVIRVEGGADSPMTIITGSDKGVWERSDTEEVLTYRDMDGETVHVYSNRPVTRAEVERIIQHGKDAQAAGRAAEARGLAAAARARAAGRMAEEQGRQAEQAAKQAQAAAEAGSKGD